MAVASRTTDLYMEGPSKLNAPETPVYPPNEAPVADLSPSNQIATPPPPMAPAPVPPPTRVEVTNQPVVIKHRMADEGKDGRVRDTSMEAVTDPNRDLNFRNLTDESENAPKPALEPKPPEVAPPGDKPPETPAKPPEVSPVQEKVYAGKFKSIEELEKGYDEAQKLITRQGQEKAELQRKVETPPPAPVVKTPEQIAAEEADKNKFLTEFVADPKAVITRFQQEAVQQTQIALTTQQIRNEWAKNNPDIAEHESRVAFEMGLLAQSDPELAKNPVGLLNKATDNFRQFTGKIRTEGAKEALTQETRVIPLVTNTAPPAATEQSPQKTPLNSDDAYNLHMRMLKEQEQRSHRGLRR